ncbi:PepSY-associated TM helix domain-containing protein [uncultured Bacteroides sp.]|uniref:PepSY-associated TM helix domain-containing protein n=1 Tax=uncultured Bacteroides sp. TaxID=162156 RepID=UPI002AA7BD4C|nr:PepSY-associated TM helix domain-containing protein [uncultured Bacteroides sp.]
MKKLSVRTLFRKLHLWLGLPSGIVVFIVAITGCIYAFQNEIKELFRPTLVIEASGQTFLSPEELKEKVSPYVFSNPADSSNAIYGVTYATYHYAAAIACNLGKDGYTLLYVNPYNGGIIYTEKLKDDFFRIILDGHRSLWLPYAIGRPIVGWSVILFVLVLLSGLVLWIPHRKTKKTFKAGLKIKWKAPFSRLNYDLHNVLGFYTALFALIIALTGLTWSFNWFSKTYYGLVTAGKRFEQWEIPVSNSAKVFKQTDPSTLLWEKMNKEYPIGRQGTFRFDYPQKPTDVFTVCFNPANDGTYYQSEYRFFDRNTLQEVKGGGTYGIKQSEASRGDKLYRMTYDIHVGAILGLPGRILVFITSLIIASLPVTGCIIWWRKKRKKKVIGNSHTTI